MLSAAESVFAYRFVFKTIDMLHCFDMEGHTCLNAFTRVPYMRCTLFKSLEQPSALVTVMCSHKCHS